MATEADKLFALDARFSVDIDNMTEEFLSDLEGVLSALRSEISALAIQLEEEGGRIVATQISLGIAQKAESMLASTLLEAGFAAAVAKAYGDLPELLKYTPISEAAFAFGTFDSMALEAFRLLKINEFTDLFGEFTREAASIVMRGVMGAGRKADLITAIVEVLDTTSHNGKTLYQTALAEFVQTCTALKSDNTPQEKFLYTGPIDGKIRPFCLLHVGRVYAREAIDGMDNGQLDNVFITRGGYNCRHQWRRISPLSEMNKLSDGEFAPGRSEELVSEVEAGLAQNRPRSRRGGA